MRLPLSRCHDAMFVCSGSRSAASSVVVFINWSANLTVRPRVVIECGKTTTYTNITSWSQVGLLFPLVLVKELSPPNTANTFTFLPFAILLSFFTAFTYLFLPETKGVTVGETSQLLQDKGWRNRRSYQ